MVTYLDLSLIFPQNHILKITTLQMEMGDEWKEVMIIVHFNSSKAS